MKRPLRRRPIVRDQSGMTLIEMLVATLMSVIIVGASTSMLISAVRDQPALSKKAQNVTTARYQLERMVREIRSAVKVEVVPAVTPTSTKVTVVAQVRRVACGGAPQTDPDADPVPCKVTYSCSGETCTRSEANMEGTPIGTATVAASGLGDTDVFCFVPSANSDPTECGPVQEEGPEGAEPDPPTFVGVNLEVPNPEGSGLLTIADGATLRAAAFSQAFSS